MHSWGCFQVNHGFFGTFPNEELLKVAMNISVTEEMIRGFAVNNRLFSIASSKLRPELSTIVAITVENDLRLCCGSRAVP
jgi:hypothetical protein